MDACTSESTGTVIEGTGKKCDSATTNSSKKKKSKKKDRKRKHSSSNESSGLEEEAVKSKSRPKHKKKCKKRHKHEKDKSKPKKSSNSRKNIVTEEDSIIGPEVPGELLQKAQSMAPMLKEEWEKRQKTIRRVYDEKTGRSRLVRGEGEIIEEIVSRERHKEINRTGNQLPT